MKMSKLIVAVFVLLGCVQFASAAVITVGQSGADYTDFAAALNAITVADTTVRFIDSASYDLAIRPKLQENRHLGLTIESAVGKKATINLTEPSAEYGMYFRKANQTLQNVVVINNQSWGVISTSADATGFVIKNVDFIHKASTGAILIASPGMEVSYSTFYGASAAVEGGMGVYVNGAADATLSIDHCCFDNTGFAPIRNTAGFAMSVTNCAFGDYYVASTYRKAIYVAGALTEDYNVYYVEDPIAFGEVAATITFGANTVKKGLRTDIFIGDTSAGDWEVGIALRTAASDGSTIGARQWFPTGTIVTIE